VEPYAKMREHLTTASKTEIDLRFQDALQVDYSVLDYDMVFTSPPYYNKEIYGSKEAPYKTNDEWDEKFYKPIFRVTYDNLKKEGHYCLNIPQCIYEKICVPMFGEAASSRLTKKPSNDSLTACQEDRITSA
jgi:tRNA1(Val) A37 N6-methylase TrmN6